MSDPIRLGIAGLGTVGAGVVKIVRQKAPLLEARSGRPITISAVSARNREKDRGVSLAAYDWEDDPVTLATRDDGLRCCYVVDRANDRVCVYDAANLRVGSALELWTGVR